MGCPGLFSFVYSLGFLFFCVVVVRAFHLLLFFQLQQNLLHFIEFFTYAFVVLLNELILFGYFLYRTVRICLFLIRFLLLLFLLGFFYRLRAHHICNLFLLVKSRCEGLAEFIHALSHLNLFRILYFHVLWHFYYILVIKRNFHLFVLRVYFLI